MMERHDIHVVPEGGDWLVRRGNERDPVGTFSTQDQAVKDGRELATEERSQLVVHTANGQAPPRT